MTTTRGMDLPQTLALALVLGVPVALGCGDEGHSSDDGNATTGEDTGRDDDRNGNSNSTGDTGDDDPDGTSGDDGPDPTSGDTDGGGTDDGTTRGGIDADCDYEIGDNGVLMFEAESLPLVEDWVEASDVAGYFADGYIC